MAEKKLLSDELRSRLGTSREVGRFSVSAEMIRRYVRAVEDSSLPWEELDTAPPAFVLTLGGEPFGEMLEASFPDGLLHGATDLTLERPVRAGDEITVAITVSNIRERNNPDGTRSAFVVFDISYTNQDGQAVAACRQTMTAYETKA